MKRFLLLAPLLFLPLAWSAVAQDGDFKPGKLPKEEQALLEPGLTLRFFADEAAKAPTDVRRVRLAALHVPEGGAPTPFVGPGPFVAKFSGFLKADLRSEFRFKIKALGKATLRINNKEVLVVEDAVGQTEEPFELSRGFNKLEIDFVAPKKGDATVRVSWAGEEFMEEPLPPPAMFARKDHADLVDGLAKRDGRFLFAMRDCAACHQLPAEVKATELAMPEMKHRAPSLAGAGSRFGKDWLVQWIQNPRSLRPKATMPAVLHGDAAPQDAADIAAYLSTLKEPIEAAKAKATAGQGEKLYNQLGCLACHHFGAGEDETESLDRYPLNFVGAKYTPEALSEFLTKPHARYPWIRMPDFKLKAEENAALVAYLATQSKGKPNPAATAGNAERGEKLFGSVGCANCHSLKTDAEPKGTNLRPSPTADQLAAGCLAADAKQRGKAPDFGFAKEQLESLRTFLAKSGDSLKRETPAEFAQRQIVNLKCNACHQRDGATTRWFQVMEEEGGSLPELLPSLTWTGEKLKPEWAAKLIAGMQDHRARPWLKARMPAFPARAEMLSLGLSHQHGFAPKEDSRPEADEEQAKIGETLLPQQGGFNCVQCHGVGKTPAKEPFEAPGINLLDAAQRLRYDYYPRWMHDPPRIERTTRMPKFAQDGKTTAIRETLDGDARKQFDAIWHYIQTLPGKKD
jgi:mono/diheme cytochrome c family protein